MRYFERIQSTGSNTVYWIAAMALLGVAFVVWFLYNKRQISQFVVRENVIRSDKMRAPTRFVQITDFHQNRHVDVRALKEKIESIQPDAIFLTGDIDDGKYPKRHFATVRLIEMLKETKIPVYAVLGNHEESPKRAREYVELLEEAGVHLLENETRMVSFEHDEFELVGTTCLSLDYEKARLTPATLEGKAFENASITDTLQETQKVMQKEAQKETQKEALEETQKETLLQPFRLVLSHAPYLIRDALRGDEDLVLCGHTHGGQVRAPLIGALYCPGEGLFPKYDRGLFDVNGVPLYIDSGLGNTKWDLRFLCPVQITVHTIQPS